MSRLIERIEWISIEDITENGWGSVDSKEIDIDFQRYIMLNEREWKQLLDLKREDKKYPKLLASVKANGLLVPGNYIIHEGMYFHGNGHHRLAAAIDLGFKRLPYIQVPGPRQLAWHWSKKMFEKANLMEYAHGFPQ